MTSSEPGDLAPARRGKRAAAPSAAGAAKHRVLVVDDNPQVRSAVARFLQKHDIHVDVAPDGKAALEELRTHPVDFVLLDVDMPEMNGFEVCRTIKKDPAHQFVPVVLLSALDAREDRIRGAEAGCDGYLGKPVDPAELLARVQAGLKQREMIMDAIRKAGA